MSVERAGKQSSFCSRSAGGYGTSQEVTCGEVVLFCDVMSLPGNIRVMLGRCALTRLEVANLRVTWAVERNPQGFV